MAQGISLDEYKRAYREIRKEEKIGFLVHLVVYVLVNAMLIAINFIYSPEAIWFFYPLIGRELEYQRITYLVFVG